MTFVPVPLGAEIIINGVRGGQEIVTTSYATHFAGWGQTEIDNLSEAVDAWVGSQLLPSVSPSYEYFNTHCRDLRLPVGFESTNLTSAGVGSRGASTGPNNQVLSVSRRSGLAGRSARGRVFWPDIPDEDKLDDNHVTAARAIVYAEIMDALTAAIAGAGWVEVIVSRRTNGVANVPAVTYPVTQYLTVDNTLDSMRRRLPGRGS